MLSGQTTRLGDGAPGVAPASLRVTVRLPRKGYHMEFLRKHQVFTAAIILVVLTVIIHSKSGQSHNAVAAAPEAQAPEAQADISVDTANSSCLASGVDDFYTGNGHIVFRVTLRNYGTAAGTANVVPVRYYSDGDVNKSAMDMIESDEIASGGTTTFRTPAFEYKAHEHALIRCAVSVDGTETPIPMN